jgi:hypothetical protein
MTPAVTPHEAKCELERCLTTLIRDWEQKCPDLLVDYVSVFHGITKPPRVSASIIVR